jgi:hypothetical protein
MNWRRSPVTFEPVSEDKADPEPTKEEADTAPVTVRDVSVPTDVMLGCAACETTRAMFALATFPVTLDPGNTRETRAGP